MTKRELLDLLSRLFPSTRWPNPFHVLAALDNFERGTDIVTAARSMGTTAARVRALCAERFPARVLLGDVNVSPEGIAKARLTLGQLLVGKCAEVAFENIYRREMHTTEFALRDLREGRTDTDYRLHNGQGRPVYRINIKFHGSQFRRAPELVGLAPEDCFALATYKIHGALRKQDADELPYMFIIVGVPGLNAASIGEQLPDEFVKFVALIHESSKVSGKRNFEDRIIERIVEEGSAAYSDTLVRVEAAQWYVLSARRADNLLRQLLFDRVFALRVRDFARQFGRAELDMHFSLSQDLTPLTKYLDVLRQSGYPRVTTLLERGDF
jgi:hypothetical protein